MTDKQTEQPSDDFDSVVMNAALEAGINVGFTGFGTPVSYGPGKAANLLAFAHTIRAHLEAQGWRKVPEGYIVVKREVTDRMIWEAAQEYDEWLAGGNAGTNECIRAMLKRAMTQAGELKGE